jgi:hypothetical protein
VTACYDARVRSLAITLVLSMGCHKEVRVASTNPPPSSRPATSASASAPDIPVPEGAVVIGDCCPPDGCDPKATYQPPGPPLPDIPRIDIASFTVVAGDLDTNTIKRYVRQRVPDLTSCSSSPTMAGTIAVSVTIEPDGHVSAAEASDPCVKGILTKIQFPKSEKATTARSSLTVRAEMKAPPVAAPPPTVAVNDRVQANRTILSTCVHQPGAMISLKVAPDGTVTGDSCVHGVLGDLKSPGAPPALECPYTNGTVDLSDGFTHVSKASAVPTTAGIFGLDDDAPASLLAPIIQHRGLVAAKRGSAFRLLPAFPSMQARGVTLSVLITPDTIWVGMSNGMPEKLSWDELGARLKSIKNESGLFDGRALLELAAADPVQFQLIVRAIDVAVNAGWTGVVLRTPSTLTTSFRD